MLRLISAAMLSSIAAFVVLGAAEAKGPLRVVITGGDLAAPIALDRPIDGRDMFGDGVQVEPPLPYPQFIYTLEVYPEHAEATAPAETISYYPAHDGLPPAIRTRYGFFAVTEDFESVLRGLLASRETSGGTSPLLYVAPGLALGLLLLGGGFAARRVRRPSRHRA